jgi:hypothetical protein
MMVDLFPRCLCNYLGSHRPTERFGPKQQQAAKEILQYVLKSEPNAPERLPTVASITSAQPSLHLLGIALAAD